MSTRYLVECSCGEKIAVGAGQAGQVVRCGCGRDVNVPLLRELRALPSVDAPEPGRASAAPAARPRLRGKLVFLGVLGVIFGLSVSGLLGWVQSRIDHSWSLEVQRDFDSQFIDSLPAAETFNAWHELEHEGLGEKQPSIHMLNRGHYVTLGRFLRWTLAFSAACALFTAVAALVKPRSRGPETAG